MIKDERLINKKIVVIVSGGMDSVTSMYYALEHSKDVKVLSFNYGQKHKKELVKAKELIAELGLEHHIVDIQYIKDLISNSVLTSDNEVPEGHYAEDNMKATVVPNRNAIMLSIAYGYAVSNECDFLLFGVHSGDHFIYPDCRPQFAEKINEALILGNEGFGLVQIVAPFINISKSDIATMGIELNVPFEKTWTCYKGLERPCLKCGTCVERTEAFLDNNSKDPLLTDEEWEVAVNYYKEVSNG